MERSYIKLCVKQGEELNFGFTIQEGDNPLDLSQYTIIVEAKQVPLVTYPSLFTKEITEVSDINTVGQINYPQQGQFVLHLLPEDTSHPIGDYSFIVRLTSPHLNDIISSNCCNNAIYRICEQ